MRRDEAGGGRFSRAAGMNFHEVTQRVEGKFNGLHLSKRNKMFDLIFVFSCSSK